MKTKVLKNNFREGLSTVEGIVVKSATLPILHAILLSAEKNFLELAATDLQIGIRYKILAKNEAEGKTVIPAKILSSFVGLLADNQLSLSLGEKGFSIESQGFHTTLKTMDPEEFPIIPALKGDETSLEISSQELCRGIDQVIRFVGQSSIRPELSGILFFFHETMLKIVATDSFRLAEKTIKLDIPFSPENGFIVPQKTGRALIPIFEERTGKISISFSANQAVFDYSSEKDPSQAQIQVVSRLIEGEYPRYQDVIPAASKTKVRVNRTEFLNHIRAASIFSGKTNDVHLLVEPERKVLQVSAQNIEVGENVSVLPAHIQGEKTEVSFNWRFLSEGISCMQSQEIELGMNGQDGPSIITATQDEGYLYVVMPIKS